MKINKKGISLIVLIITIIVMLIIIGAVVLRSRDDDVTGNAMKARIKNNINVIKEDYNLYLSKLKTDYATNEHKSFNTATLDMTSDEVNEKITSIADAGLTGEFKVENGELIYTGEEDEIKEAINELGGITIEN